MKPSGNRAASSSYDFHPYDDTTNVEKQNYVLSNA